MTTHTPNFIEIEVTFCGRKGGHLRPTLLGRLTRADLKTKAKFGRLLRPLAWK